MGTPFEIEDYCLSNLERAKKAGVGQITAMCPWCGRYGGFYVNISNGHYCCHKCDSRGLHLIGVIAEIEQITWFEAKEFVLKKTIKFKRKGTTKLLVKKIKKLKSSDDEGHIGEDDVNVELPKEFIPVFKNGKWKFPSYLKRRGIEKKTAKEWGLGFCNDGDYGYRVVIPISCPYGKSFTTRAIDSSMVPKMLNPPNSDHGKMLLGWNILDKERDVVIVEGPFDAIKTYQNGFNVLSLCGKVLHDEQMQQLRRLRKNISVTIMTDPEELKAPYKIAKALNSHFDDVYVAKLPLGVDPGDANKKQVKKAYEYSKKYNGVSSNYLKDLLSKNKEKLNSRYSG